MYSGFALTETASVYDEERHYYSILITLYKKCQTHRKYSILITLRSIRLIENFSGFMMHLMQF